MQVLPQREAFCQFPSPQMIVASGRRSLNSSHRSFLGFDDPYFYLHLDKERSQIVSNGASAYNKSISHLMGMYADLFKEESGVFRRSYNGNQVIVLRVKEPEGI